MRLQLAGTAVALLTALAPATSRADSPWRISSDVLGYGDSDNVLILSPQVSVHRDIDDDGGTVSVGGAVDAISAASVDVVSQATDRFFEVRSEANLAASKFIRGYLPSVGYRFSTESDFVSHGGTLGAQKRLAGADTTLSVVYGLTLDAIYRSGTPHSSFSESLQTHSLDTSLTQVVDRKTVLRGVLTLSLQHGYMEKPYRFVPLFDAAGIAAARAAGVALSLDTFDDYRLATRPPEQVPDGRVRAAAGVRALRYIERFDGSVRLDYQLYLDSWGVMGHVLEPALYTSLPLGLKANLFGRFYFQSAASFWEREYVVSGTNSIPRWRTLDRNLSSYYNATGGLRVEWRRRTLSAYAEGSTMYTGYRNFLLLDSRVAIMTMVGLRWEP